MNSPWITVVGIGDDGLDGLPEKTRGLLDGADLLVGGDRHQAMAPDSKAERLTWACGLDKAMAAMEAWRGKRVVVLATGDPMCFGAGTSLRRRFAPEELTVIPHVSVFSHAAARMGWSLPDCDQVTLHGRAVENIRRFIQPGVRIIALSWNGETPKAVAEILEERGFGRSAVTVFEHLGGDAEKRIDGMAKTWKARTVAQLNTLCVDCVAGPGAVALPTVPGLPEGAFEHDRPITKREVRAATLAKLMPGPGQLLWDVGSGCGSVSIEWMRSCRNARAVAIEKNPSRLRMIEGNAKALGVPSLDIVEGVAPDCLAGLDGRPDAVFLGGGVSIPGLAETCLEYLNPGGRLVANGVTVESESALIQIFKTHPRAELTRLSISRAATVGAGGNLTGFKPMMAVTQLSVVKPW